MDMKLWRVVSCFLAFGMAVVFGIDKNSMADTNVSGFVSADTTWTAANSPYVVTGSVIVNSGVTLTVEPGVTVKLNSGKAIQVDGTLLAKGTSAKKITFTRSSSTSSNWGYILFNDSSADASYNTTSGDYESGSILEYCVVEYAGGSNVSDNGAIRLNNANPFINYCTIQNNSASGIYAYNLSSGVLKIKNNTISDNKSSSGGGGLYAYCSSSSSAVITISNNTISRNSGSSGGGIYVYNTGGGAIAWDTGSGKINITNNTINDNTASSGAGGGIYARGIVTISNNTISGNTSSNSVGGGIHLSTHSTMTLSKNIIRKNSATYGGGIYNSSDNHLVSITDNLVVDNTATSGDGGGIYTWNNAYYSSKMTISNNIIGNNTASANGGGMYSSYWLGYAYSWNATIYACSISKNSITGNSAKNAASIYNLVGDGNDFKYNSVTNNKATGSTDTYAIYVKSSPISNYNSIFNNKTTYELWYDSSQGSSNLTAENNWWGTSDDSGIQGKIYDWGDDSTKAIVDYIPYETAIRTDCPISPPTGLTATSGTNQITLNWTANAESDTNGYKVYWDTDSGHSYTNSKDVGKVTSYTITGLSDGKYYVTVTAYDASYSSSTDDTATIINENQTNGNESWYAEEKSVTLGSGTATPIPSPSPSPTSTPSDTTAPGGSLSISGGLLYTNSTAITLALSATDNVGVTDYYLSESSTTPSASASGWTPVTSTTSYSAGVSYTVSSNEGGKTIYAWYKDAAGNVSGASSVSITLDKTPPTVTITSPTTSATYTASGNTISLGGAASDSASGISGVTWSSSKGGSGTASGTASWTASGISLSAGDNIITVTAKDFGGNTGTDTLTVTYGTATATPAPTATVSPVATVTPAASPTPTAAVSPTPSATPTAATGSIVGRVTDQGGSPITGATVSTGAGGYAAVTDADGIYSITKVAPGVYTVTASASGYVSDSKTVAVTAGAPAAQDFILSPSVKPTPVLSPTPAASPTVKPTPSPSPSPTPGKGTAVIYGTVYDDTESPMRSASLSLTGPDGYSGSANTDEDGSYSFDGLVAGDYTLQASKSGYQTASASITLEDGDIHEENFILETISEGIIYGYVLDIKGDPVEGVKLSLQGLRSKYRAKAASDQDGYFEFTGLGADKYVITAKKQRYQTKKTSVALEDGESKEVEIVVRKTTKKAKDGLEE